VSEVFVIIIFGWEGMAGSDTTGRPTLQLKSEEPNTTSVFVGIQVHLPSPLRLAPEAWRLFSPGKRFESFRIQAKHVFDMTT